jgi:hypothetical protein
MFVMQPVVLNEFCDTLYIQRDYDIEHFRRGCDLKVWLTVQKLQRGTEPQRTVSNGNRKTSLAANLVQKCSAQPPPYTTHVSNTC